MVFIYHDKLFEISFGCSCCASVHLPITSNCNHSGFPLAAKFEPRSWIIRLESGFEVNWVAKNWENLRIFKGTFFQSEKIGRWKLSAIVQTFVRHNSEKFLKLCKYVSNIPENFCLNMENISRKLSLRYLPAHNFRMGSSWCPPQAPLTLTHLPPLPGSAVSLRSNADVLLWAPRR